MFGIHMYNPTVVIFPSIFLGCMSPRQVCGGVVRLWLCDNVVGVLQFLRIYYYEYCCCTVYDKNSPTVVCSLRVYTAVNYKVRVYKSICGWIYSSSSSSRLRDTAAAAAVLLMSI